MGAPGHDPLARFHPAVGGWFRDRFGRPTDAQVAGWEAIAAGDDTLIAAPTGSGKTLAAFLVAIDELVRAALAGRLEDRVEVLYVSPLKALSNDIERNLEVPLTGIRARLAAGGAGAGDIGSTAATGGEAPCATDVVIRTGLRTGDTPAALRQRMTRCPPHVLVTTPESLYLMLTAPRARAMLRSVRTVIVDEVHALVRDKRGSHLALSLARLDHVCARRPVRIGLSATQRPLSLTAAFLSGTDGDGAPARPTTVVDLGHRRELDLALELVPQTELAAVCSGEQWSDILDRVAELVTAHTTTLVFVNTRRQAERVAHHLEERLGEGAIGSHHGSLSKERRLDLEARLKRGALKALVATASLELGIDVGAVDLVCQLESPRSIATFLQRIGRSGHALGLVPRGRLFPTTRDELVECTALLAAVRAGRLDRMVAPVAPLDILAQQLVAEASCEDWPLDGLHALVRRAAPYAALPRETFDGLVAMLARGIPTGLGRAAQHLHLDLVAGRVSARRGARLAALQSGGAIPEVADYRVVAEPEGIFVGTLDEDFAVESTAGDIFLLGSTSWRIRRVEQGVVRVEDAGGAPPSIPFWLGEAPARTAELSEEVGRLRRELAERLAQGAPADVVEAWVVAHAGVDGEAAFQVVRYVDAGRRMLGAVPTDRTVVFERFFDDAGGAQLVVHAPFGGRVNRAWGLALRKRFCRTFDFELQAAASDDALLLSVGPGTSFPLEDATRMLRADGVEAVLVQALLTAPMFATRWRWNVTRALAVLRARNGKRVPPQIQRMKAEDLLAAVFPQQVACQENVTGPIEVPDHPLVRQTIDDCLHEAMDVRALEDVLARIARGEIAVEVRETAEPSPFAHEILGSKPYTYLDDAPLEERRARAVTLRRSLPVEARDLAALDPEAVERVREEVRPDPRTADEVYDLLTACVWLSDDEARGHEAVLGALAAARRAARFGRPDGMGCWTSAERAGAVHRIFGGVRLEPDIGALVDPDGADESEERAVAEAIRGRLEIVAVATVPELALATGLDPSPLAMGIATLEAEGALLRGRYRAGAREDEVADRRLLARMHRATLDRLRREIEPVPLAHLVRFLLRWQHVAPGTALAGVEGLRRVVAQLQGLGLPAASWEAVVLPARLAGYDPAWLDRLCWSGDVVWGRASPARPDARGEAGGRGPTLTAVTSVSLALRGDRPWILAGVRRPGALAEPLGAEATAVLAALDARGALFLDDLVAELGLERAVVERALCELVALGRVAADGFEALRSLLGPRRVDAPAARARLRRGAAAPATPHGRWSLVAPPERASFDDEALAEAWAEQLLERYGVVCRALLEREPLVLGWRPIVRALRRMEARGTVRGGRFVAGLAGEQYAAPGAVDELRHVRRTEPSGEVVRLSAVDPLNVTGWLLPGERVPALSTRWVFLRDGLPVAEEDLTAAERAALDRPAPVPSAPSAPPRRADRLRETRPRRPHLLTRPL